MSHCVECPDRGTNRLLGKLREKTCLGGLAKVSGRTRRGNGALKELLPEGNLSRIVPSAIEANLKTAA